MEDNEKTFEPPVAPILPDGIGLTHGQVAALLAEQCKTVVSPDDPILMMATLFNAYLHEQDKLLQRHNQALTSILSARTDRSSRPWRRSRRTWKPAWPPRRSKASNQLTNNFGSA